MPPKHSKQKRRFQRVALLILIGVLAVALTAGAVFGIYKFGQWAFAPSSQNDGGSQGGTTTTTQPEGPKAPQIVATATVGNSGDILIHTPVLKSAKVSSGVYDFAPMFQYMKPYVSALDYAAVNFEFGIGTGESDYYQREMLFRVPTSLIDTLMDTGYTLGLCANNHVSNGSSLTLTAQTYIDRNVDFIGLRKTTAEKRYLVKDINGIKIGFVNYTYGATTSANNRVNYFSTSNLDAFYTDMEKQMADMKAEGAEAIVVYLHWGNEYQVSPASSQTKMSQKLCEMGVDVIVGGHPHKIQPLELIEAENGNKTVCLYSMGNFLSNQTIESMYGGSRAANNAAGKYNFQDYGTCKYPDVSSRYKDTNWDKHDATCNDNGHTEDGLLFNFTFAKYEDGTVLLSGVNVLPTWCYCTKRENSNYNDYRIIPLDTSVEDWTTAFGVAEKDLVFAKRSYDRTMALVGDGITAINTHCQTVIDDYVADFKAAQEL